MSKAGIVEFENSPANTLVIIINMKMKPSWNDTCHRKTGKKWLWARWNQKLNLELINIILWNEWHQRNISLLPVCTNGSRHTRGIMWISHFSAKKNIGVICESLFRNDVGFVMILIKVKVNIVTVSFRFLGNAPKRQNN